MDITYRTLAQTPLQRRRAVDNLLKMRRRFDQRRVPRSLNGLVTGIHRREDHLDLFELGHRRRSRSWRGSRTIAVAVVVVVVLREAGNGSKQGRSGQEGEDEAAGHHVDGC